jgi:aminoglycoside phosphotransferase (APT) family kinase protein
MADASTARLTAALAGAGVSWDQVAGCRSLTGGTFNAVHLVGLADGTGLVVKIPPGPDTPLLRYEQGILGTEALYYQLAGQCRDVTVPAVIAVDATGAAGGYLVMTQCPGSPWPELTPLPGGAERAELRAELGRQVARLHTITGTGFGYPSLAVGPLRESWREAFLDMVDAVLADAGRFAVTLPRPAAGVRDWFTARAAVLDQVTTPVLVHFDLWDGNILVESSSAGRRIGALIDAERAFWGDPLAEFISLALFADIEQDHAFLQGYRAGGGTATFDNAARQRLCLYQAYLYLIMWVEAVPRQASQERGGWLFDRVFRPLAAALDEGSPQRGEKLQPHSADLRRCGRDRHDLAGLIDQLTGQESHIPAPADDPSAPGEPSRPGRAQELHVQVGGRRELARPEGCHQRRAEGVVQHRRDEPALDSPRRIQELITGRERDLDRPGVGVDGNQFPAKQNRGGRKRRPARHRVPERALAGHWSGSAGRGLPGATVRASIPRVARSALSGITGKMPASRQFCLIPDQS